MRIDDSKEVEIVHKQDKRFREKVKETFELVKKGLNKKIIFKWRQLRTYKSRDNYVVLDSKDNLICGFMAKKFRNGISIIWIENYSEGKYKQLTKEIIIELLRSGVEEVYTDDKHSLEMSKTHKKIIKELPYSQIDVKRFDSISTKIDDDLNDMFSDRKDMFLFTLKSIKKSRTFEEALMDPSMYTFGLTSELNMLLEKTDDDDEFCDLPILLTEAKEKIDREYLDKKIEEYQNDFADFYYEHKTSWREDNEKS